MRKLGYISLLLLLVLSATVIPVRSVEVGDSIIYVVNKVSGSFSYSANGSTTSGSTSNYRVGNEKVPKGTEIRVNITSKIAGLVGYKIDDNGTLLATASSSEAAFGLGIFYTVFNPFVAMGLMSLTVEPIEVDKGIHMGDWVYVAPTSINWDDISNNFVNASFWQDFMDVLTVNNAGSLNVTGTSKLLDNDETISLSFGMNGDYTNTTEETDLKIKHSIRYDYSILGRNLLGILQETDISGTVEGSTATFKVSIQVVKKGYTGLGGSVIPGFGFFAALLPLCLISTCWKRKKKMR
ncbi:MAG: choice-of-anchor S family protein [Candidatus Odinarchaeota archaeon]